MQNQALVSLASPSASNHLLKEGNTMEWANIGHAASTSKLFCSVISK